MSAFLRRSIIVLLLILACTGSIASAQAPLAVPGVPTNVIASDGAYTDKIRVTWSAVLGATYYRLAERATGQHAWTYHSPAASPFDHAAAISDAVYEYQVAACNVSGCSAYSSPIATGYLGVGTPGSVRASDGTYSDKLRVTWTAAANATSYRIYRAEDPLFPELEAEVGDVLSWDDGAYLLSGKLLYYWVQGCNANECGDMSAYDSGFRRLGRPTIAATDGFYCDYVNIAWTYITGATYYKLRRGNDLFSYDTEWPNVTDTHYRDYSATASVIYYYSVMACNDDTGCSDISDTTIGYRDAPPAPEGVTASDGAYADRVNVQWDSVLGADYYELQRGLSLATMADYVSNLTETSYNDYDTLPGVTYYYRAIAGNDCGCRNRSNADAGWRAAPTPTPTATPAYNVRLPLLMKPGSG